MATFASVIFVDIDDCDPDPCEHGTCEDGVNEFSCVCDRGWTGDHCDTGKKGLPLLAPGDYKMTSQ